MRIERVSNVNEAMKSVEPDNIGYKIMKEKTQILAFKIEALQLQAMQILKQDALSNGAELVTPRDAVLCKKTHYDCLLFGTQKALKLLISKMQMQPFGLKAIAQDLKVFLQTQKDYGKKIMGIINVDSNSFYKEFNANEAIRQIYHYIELGVDIIDIGAVSSRPGANYIESKIELERLAPIFDEIKKLDTTTQFSIDTYNEETAKIAVECGFSIINDISGRPETMVQILQKNSHVSYILTHIQGTPLTMQECCKYENLILDIDTFFTQKIAYLKEHDCNNIILDVGIGFAKDVQQNIALLNQLKHFKHFKLPLLIGASHKSFLAKILESSSTTISRNIRHDATTDYSDHNLDPATHSSFVQNLDSINPVSKSSTSKDILSATLIAHCIAWQNGANIVRVHDVKEHIEMLKIMEALRVNDIDVL